jgi:hypothetical protein
LKENVNFQDSRLFRKIAMNEQSIFTAALGKKTASEREAYLDEACGQNAGLRAQVEDLLAADAGAGSFLEHPPAGVELTVSASGSGTDPIASALPDNTFPFLEPCDKPDRIGRLGVYEIIEVVGQGGMGSVFRAMDTKLHRIVAVKVMAQELAANPTAVKRFLREARSAAAVVHDHVVTIHAIDDHSRPELQHLGHVVDEIGDTARLPTVCEVDRRVSDGKGLRTALHSLVRASGFNIRFVASPPATHAGPYRNRGSGADRIRLTRNSSATRCSLLRLGRRGQQSIQA